MIRIEGAIAEMDQATSHAKEVLEDVMEHLLDKAHERDGRH